MENLYRLEIESLDLGPDVRAVGLELIDPGNARAGDGKRGGRYLGRTCTCASRRTAVGHRFLRSPGARTRILPSTRQSRFASRTPHAIVIPQPARDEASASI